MRLLKRKTRTTVAVLKHLVSKPAGTWGLEIAKSCGLAPATVYLILDRLSDIGLVSSHWEESDRNGPRRRIYCLTKTRLPEVMAEIEECGMKSDSQPALSPNQGLI